jgi:hypothetical protein
MRGTSWIDLPDGNFSYEAAFAVLTSLYPGEKSPKPQTAQDVYVSCSWQEQDGASARAVCAGLVEQGFRLVGDAKDRKGFASGDRVERIITSCGALVAVIPYRDSINATAAEKPYKYFLTEIDLANKHGLPIVVVADPRVRRTDGSDQDWIRLETEATECNTPVKSSLEMLTEDWRDPPDPHYVFCALDLESNAARATGPIRHLIERVTGLRTIVGNEIHEEPLQPAIIRTIRNAFLVVADISDDNLNSCIEAGMALAADANLELVSRGPSRRPPFMLRTLQMPTYANEIEQVGVVHKIIRPYRRRIINAEL